MKIDVEILENSVIPKITSAKSILGECIGIIGGISIPGDFPEGNKIKAAIGKIGEIAQLLTNAATSVGKSANLFGQTQKKNDELIDKLFESMLNGSGATLNNKKTKNTTNKKANESKRNDIITVGATTYKYNPTTRKSRDHISKRR
ncbi:MAG: hypothetical protein IKF83_00730 [Clostridia bacterium]|nr:hypothetical protein [Clostridia bacterium]